MTYGSLISGYVDLADWLYFIAAILFAVTGIMFFGSGRRLGDQPVTIGLSGLVPLGLALIAIAWLVT